MTKTVESNAAYRFSELFKGYENGFGTYEAGESDSSGKVQGRAQTHANGPTPLDYLGHLEGKKGIGIIPLLKNDKCWFGAIDIDIKGDIKLKESLPALEERIRDLQLPLVLCQSKSKGAHLYLFGKDAIAARQMQGRMAEFASALGYGGCEVFPKQVMRLKETDYGNWINMPYFGNTRVALHEGRELELEEFLDLAESMRITSSALRAFAIPMSNLFVDGPPCLQHMATFGGFGEGGRNNALQNVGTYLRKKFPDDWPDHLVLFNETNVHPPLPSDELAQIIRGGGKKDYNFTCKQPPISNYCNRKECVKREFGVAGGDGGGDVRLPITGLTKFIAGDSYRWGVSTTEAIVEFSTEELMSLEAHRKKFVELLNVVLPPIPQPAFLKQIQELVDKAETVYDPEDASDTGQLVSAVESWFLDKGSAANADEMIKGKWWRDDATGSIYFTSESLEEYLVQIKRIRQVQKHKLWRQLEKRFNAKHDRLLIKGKRRRVWVIKDFEFEEATPLEIRDIEQKEEMI